MAESNPSPLFDDGLNVLSSLWRIRKSEQFESSLTYVEAGQKWGHLKLAFYSALEPACQTWQGELLQSPGVKLFQAEINQHISE